MKNISLEQEMEKVFIFLVSKIITSQKNRKPVFLHSIRVGLILYNEGQGREVVIASILHDILEDTEVTYSNIRKKFGKKVANLILANTFDTKIHNKEKQYKELFGRCKKAGRDALIIKAVDILDNSNYYELSKNKKEFLFLLKKMRDFIKLSRTILKQEPMYRQLVKQYNRLQNV